MLISCVEKDFSNDFQKMLQVERRYKLKSCSNCDTHARRYLRTMLVAMVTTEARSLRFPGTMRVVLSFASLPN